MKHTPMMQQYAAVKAKLKPGTILLFRLGDFYESFFEDAPIVASVLGVTLATRREIPMAGIVFHAINKSVRQLIDAGHVVALCESPKDSKPVIQ